MIRPKLFRAQAQEIDYSVFEERWRTPSGVTLELGRWYHYSLDEGQIRVTSEAFDSIDEAVDAQP